MKRPYVMLALGASAALVMLDAPAQQLKDDPRLESTQTETYLEEITPSGRLLPNTTPAGARDVPMPTAVTVPAPQASARELSRASLRDFRAAYEAAKRPRIAVYFNRALSAEVREWIPSNRLVNEGTAEFSRQDRHSGSTRVEGKFQAASSASGDVNQDVALDARFEGKRSGGGSSSASGQSVVRQSVYAQQYVGPTGERDDPAEHWKLKFEDSVARSFLDAGARIVDRATIFRLMSFEQPNTSGLAGSISTNRVETGALKQYADILLELLVVADPEAPSGYAFRATAKRVVDGSLVATAYVDGSEIGKNERPRYVATDRGYVKEVRPLPTVVETSEALALAVMQSMAGAL